MMKKVLMFFFFLSITSSSMLMAQLECGFNVETGTIFANYDPFEDPNYVLDEDCMNDCIQDQYYNGAHYSCEDECGNISQVEYYYFGYYSPFPSASPLLYPSEFQDRLLIVTKNFTDLSGSTIGYNLENQGENSEEWIDWWNNESVCFKVWVAVSYTDGSSEIYECIVCN